MQRLMVEPRPRVCPSPPPKLLSVRTAVAAASTQRPRLNCPVQGCAAADSSRHSGWLSAVALSSHVDGLVLGCIPGRPEANWFDQQRLVAGAQSGKLVSTTSATTMHRRYWGQVVATRASRQTSNPANSRKPAILANLPTHGFVCSRQTKCECTVLAGRVVVFGGEGVPRLPAYAVQFSDKNAWSLVGTEADTDFLPQRRVAWTELIMISKACLQHFLGGKSKPRRNRNIIANRPDGGLESAKGCWMTYLHPAIAKRSVLDEGGEHQKEAADLRGLRAERNARQGR